MAISEIRMQVDTSEVQAQIAQAALLLEALQIPDETNPFLMGLLGLLVQKDANCRLATLGVVDGVLKLKLSMPELAGLIEAAQAAQRV